MDFRPRFAHRRSGLLHMPLSSVPFLLAFVVGIHAFVSAEAQVPLPASTVPPGQPFTLVRAPYLQVPTTDGMTIVWATRESGAPSVRFGLDWTAPGFDDSSWRQGRTSLGYGGEDNVTTLSDMRGGYLTVFARRTFTVADPSAIERMFLSVDYSDGFVAYLNGAEVARADVSGYQTDHKTPASRSHAPTTKEFDISAFRPLLLPGENALSISGHNDTLDSADFSLNPSLRLDTPCAVTAIAPGDVWRYYGGAGYPAELADEKTGTSTSYSALGGYHQHEVTLTGLQPGTRYAYRVHLNEQDAAGTGLTFRTATTPAMPYVSFLVFGDSGDGGANQKELRDRMLEDRFDLAIPVGDVAYNDGKYEELQRFYFDVYKTMMEVTPFVPTSGNHEYHTSGARPFFDVSVLPENGPDGFKERYFSFDYGNVHFVALDSEQISSRQRDWLRADLEASTQPWTVVYMHRTIFGEGSGHSIQESANLRSLFAPVFEEFHVDLVLAGHNHVYGRSVPIKDSQSREPYGAATTTVDGGVVYVTTGGGGGRLNEAFTDSFHEPPGASFKGIHYTKVVVADCTLRLQAIDVNGEVRDSYTVSRCHPSQPPIAETGARTLGQPCPVLATPTVQGNTTETGTGALDQPRPVLATPAVRDDITPAREPEPDLPDPVLCDQRHNRKIVRAFLYTGTVFSARRSAALVDPVLRFSAQGLWTRVAVLWPMAEVSTAAPIESTCAPP